MIVFIMIDLKYVKEHMAEVKENIRLRGMNVDVDEVLDLYEKRNSILRTVEETRRQRNENAKKMKSKISQDQRQELIEEGKQLKETLAGLETELTQTEEQLHSAAAAIPNRAHPQAPAGKEEKDNLELKRTGDPPKFSFTPKDHVELALELELVDFDTAAKVTGPKFYYLKNEAVYLELALIRYALDIVTRHGFTPLVTPDIAKEEIAYGIGFNPRGPESNIYTLNETGTCLVGTAEITLGGYYAGKVLADEQLPVKMAGISHCFRREAGAAGQFSKGLYRVHQFTKVEMFVFCRPEESEAMHQYFLEIEEEVFSGLGIPYRVVDTCTGDLGAPAYRKFDIEAWMPGRGDSGAWGEVTSTSNCTDYQARRLGTRYKKRDGTIEHVHMLNGTAVAVSRALVAILENYQQPDGSVKVPEKLVPYTGFDAISRP